MTKPNPKQRIEDIKKRIENHFHRKFTYQDIVNSIDEWIKNEMISRFKALYLRGCTLEQAEALRQAARDMMGEKKITPKVNKIPQTMLEKYEDK
jgi:hypothetical protein